MMFRNLVHGILLSSCFTQALLLLSDLPTPTLVIDVALVSKLSTRLGVIPSLAVGKDHKLMPVPVDTQSSHCPHKFPSKRDDDDASSDHDMLNEVGIVYWHASVVRGRNEAKTSDPGTFLAELDLPSFPTVSDSYLALGLNNHHVISYYWARSAGAGASMEAPGIAMNGKCLVWQDDQGPTVCNSNDGKRSEWANFLRPNDQVQLVPHDPQTAVLEWLNLDLTTDAQRTIYGISSSQRPLGSEPAVVCEWKLMSDTLKD